jgi:hypothetical protein
MARVTRSKKLDIAEDHTSFPTQSQLPDTPTHQVTPLTEINVSMRLNTMKDDTAVQEIKGLKAAYRGALGIAKRGKKARSKKGSIQESVVSTEDIVDGQATPDNIADSPVPEATRQLLQSRQGSLRSLLENISDQSLIRNPEDPTPEQESQQPAPTGRTTRRQAAKAQAGQYSSSDVFIPQQDSSAIAQKLRDLDFVALFGGRYTRPTRVQRVVKPSQEAIRLKDRTDRIIFLAEEALKSAKICTPQVNLEDTNEEQRIDDDHTSVTLAATSPVKTLAEVEEAYGPLDSPAPAEGGDDSFVEQIIARSPAKTVSRIEDSLEAIDQLEEALEAVGEVALAEQLASPEKVRDKSHTPRTRPESLERSESLRTAEPRVEVKDLRRYNSVRGKAGKSACGSMRVKPTAQKPTSIVKKATSMTFNSTHSDGRKSVEPPKTQPIVKPMARRPISLLPPKETVKSTKPLTRPSFELPGDAIARKLKEQREARLAQRDSSEDSHQTSRSVSDPKVKSTKPPTKSSFELPGEALSRKKREAHEARIKAQEEEERKRREFKAKPIRKSVVPDFVPRETAASRARQNKIGMENVNTGELVVSKQDSIVVANVGAYRPSTAQLNQANSSAPRAKAPIPIRKQTPVTTHGPSMSGRAMQRTVSATDVQVQRQRAKEIYERDTKMSEDIGRERREREAAAKRAREEAAERGRQASREWAEKQMAKKMASSEKLNAGFGPGGQLGLRE